MVTITLLFTLMGCDNGQFKGDSRYSNDYFNTYVELICYDYFDSKGQAKLDSAWEKVQAALKDIDNSISLSNATSDISRFNVLTGNQAINISNTTAQMIRIAKDMYAKTGGAYNACVYPLVDLYGFSSRFGNITTEQEYQQMDKKPYDRENLLSYSQQLPQQKYIDAFLQLTDFESIELRGNAVDGYQLFKPSTKVQVDGVDYYMQIDLGGIGKGYAVDMVRSIMADEGYQYGVFSCGGSSIYLGKYANADTYGNINEDNFNVGITAPRFQKEVGENYLIARTSNTVVSSSGDYQDGHYYIVGEKRVCHIIDAESGYPINYCDGSQQTGICAVALFGGNGAEGDCLSTALCVMGLDKALTFLNSEDNKGKYQFVITLYDNDTDYCQVITNIADYTMSSTAQQYYRMASTTQNGITIYTGSN